MELTIEDVFSQGGLLAQSLDGYRERPSQIELANHVQDSLQEGAHFLAEAPTGTGKSMAYGVPAALHAIANDATVVIVTANITLQEQLIGKDLPLIAEMLGSQDLELGFELLKGMKNYVCRAALKDTVKRQRKGRENWLTPIIQWEAGTETGDKSELDEEYPSKIWSQVAVSSQDCVGKNCPDIGDCYAYKARRRAQKAHIVVANYHLLFADIMSGGNVLPEYCAVIMDEAHQAADIASDFQGLQITPWELKGLAGLLKHVDGVGQSLYRVHHLAVDQLFKHLQTVSKGERILEDPLQTDVGMAGSLRDLAAAYMLEAGNQEDGFLHELLKQKAEQARAYADELEKAAYGVEDDDGERTGVLPRDRVYYFDGEGDKLSLNTKVVDVRSFFRQHIFSKTPTVMMSATMATNDSFEFIGNQVGLNVGDYDALIVPSPFNTERVLAVIPEEPFPLPSSSDHVARVGLSILEAHEAGCGGVMGLFTSHRNLQAVAAMMRDAIPKELLLVQGQLPKAKIIERFKLLHKRGKNAVLLGTQSFWQGVDIPGQALSVVVIDKIPFPRPDDPVLYHLDRIGRNSFRDYSLPKAIIAMKQGLGRLIRTEDDFGCVVLLDVRMSTKGYGRSLKTSLPNGCFVSDDTKDISAFLQQMQGS